MSGSRSPILAGTWYPGDPEVLAAEVDGYLNAAEVPLRPTGRAVIAVVPHAGYLYSGESAGCLYGLLRDDAPRRVVILAPNHRATLDRVALSSAGAFATPLGEIPIDHSAVSRLAGNDAFLIDESAHAQEHAVEIQLPFLQRLWPAGGFQLVPALVPPLPPARRAAAGAALAEILDEDALLIVSSDFTHYGRSYGFLPFQDRIPERLEQLDAGAILKILAGDAEGLARYGETTGITMCGLPAAAVALTSGLPSGYEGALIDYRRSGDRDGDYSLSVSYASILLCTGPDEGGDR